MARPGLTLALLTLLVAGCQQAPSPPADAPGETTRAAFEGARFRTEAGDLTMVFYADDAPRTVELYRAYLREGYFVGKEFGRIVPGHVIQILDAVGAAGSTATEDARRVPLEPSPRLNFSIGAVGISRYEAPDSGGPEFFVMDLATSHLWGNYTIFGQVVESLDVVHAIARMPAVDTPRVAPQVNAIVNDRTALDPVRITAAEAVQVTLTPAQAATMPPRVGQNVRVGDLRHSLEWPADLAPGRPSTLTWCIRPYNGTTLPDPSGLRIAVTGPGGMVTLPVTPHPQYPDILRWTWAPAAAGDYDAVLEGLDGEPPRIGVHVPAR